MDFPSLIQVLRERNYDGWISLDFNYVDSAPGVTIEQDMTAHLKGRGRDPARDHGEIEDQGGIKC